ncbi:MAG: lipopolysaccharide heptosyltransferase II [Gammaproteobacteria bacterium]|nr:lipopolysaccharide heptosyltransferase II [Gammaproteobacteria bacterium]
MKFLIVGPDNLKDIVLFQSLSVQLKQRHEQCEIDVLLPARYQGLATRMPEVNRTFTLPESKGIELIRAVYKLSAVLRKESYYQAITLIDSYTAALIPKWAKIPRRTGCLSTVYWWLSPLGLFNDPRQLNDRRYTLAVDNLAALAFEPDSFLPERIAPHLLVRDVDRQRSLEKLTLQPLNAPLLVICLGSSVKSSSHWPEKHYATVARAKIKEGWQVWLMGELEALDTGNEVQRMLEKDGGDGSINLLGRTTLLETLDLLSLADAVVSCDGGLLHMAAALNRSVVALYGPDSPRHTPPLTAHREVLTHTSGCAHCFKPECAVGLSLCLNYPEPAEVIAALACLPQPVSLLC